LSYYSVINAVTGTHQIPLPCKTSVDICPNTNNLIHIYKHSYSCMSDWSSY